MGTVTSESRTKKRAWDPNTLGPQLRLSANNTVCEYIGNDTPDIGVVRADKPFTKSDGCAYYEVHILSAGKCGYVQYDCTYFILLP